MTKPEKLYENLLVELETFVKDIYRDIVSNFGKPKMFGISWDDWNFAPLGVGLHWIAEYDSQEFNESDNLKMELVQGNRLDEQSRKENIRNVSTNSITSGCDYWLDGIFPGDLVEEFNTLKEKYESMMDFFPNDKDAKNDGYNGQHEAVYWMTFLHPQGRIRG
jgi:hypothetical protein